MSEVRMERKGDRQMWSVHSDADSTSVYHGKGAPKKIFSYSTEFE